MQSEEYWKTDYTNFMKIILHDQIVPLKEQM